MQINNYEIITNNTNDELVTTVLEQSIDVTIPNWIIIENLIQTWWWYTNIIPSWTINWINLNFTLPQTPDWLQLYLNGMRQKETEDFTIWSNVITFISPPLPWDILLADYN